MKKLAVLVSGTGSLLEAMIQDGLPVEVVITDRTCRGLEIAKQNCIPTVLIPREFNQTFDRDLFTRCVTRVFGLYRVEFIAMAGFMTIFTPTIFERYGGRILNTHPSLLPLFKGHSAVEDALAAGVTETGCTIHVATERLDDGPILMQESVPVLPGDTVDTLHERIKAAERTLYPAVIRSFL